MPKPPTTQPPLLTSSLLASVLAAKARDRDVEFSIDAAICDAVIAEEFKKGFSRLPLHRRRYLACWYLEAEVDNGGLMQFFDNRGPFVVGEAAAFLKDRGPRPIAALLKKAIHALPGHKLPRTHASLMNITLADFRPDGSNGPIGRSLDKLTGTFYRLNQHRQQRVLTRARLEYVNEHAAEFGLL